MNAGQADGRFTRHLAQRLIAEKEYAPKMVPEAAPLAEACDLVLTRTDGLTMTIVYLVDREPEVGSAPAPEGDRAPMAADPSR